MSLTDRSYTALALREVESEILEVRLNRPDNLNAINGAMIAELLDVFAALNNSRSIRTVILTGAGRGFCAGADMLEPAEPGAIPGSEGMGELGFVYRYQEYIGGLTLAIHECDKPVIAAINGVTLGGGCALALACDIRLASDKARIGAGVLKTGLSNCDVGISYLLPRIVGAGIASELMLTNRFVEAEEALRIGLASRITSADELDAAALEIARAIREGPEYGVWMTKKTLRAALDANSLRQAMEMENRTQVLGYFTGAMTAMREAFSKGENVVWPKL